MKVSDIILAEKKRAEASAKGVEYKSTSTTPKEQLFAEAKSLGWPRDYQSSTVNELKQFIQNANKI